MDINEFLLEGTLNKLNPELHRNFSDCVLVMSTMLEQYTSNFPRYTDHSMRHALEVIQFCNYIISDENIDKMNDYEIYILLMGIYLHDAGMGVSVGDFNEFIAGIDTEDFLANNPEADHFEMIRKFHHEISGQFIEKYAPFFDITDESIIHGIKQVARGHRVTDLLDEEEYPINYTLSNGKEICLPYLAALIRLADEVDVGRDRNPEYMYTSAYAETGGFTANDYREFNRHKAIRHVRVTREAFILEVDGPDDVFEDILHEIVKIQATLDDCRNAVNGRTKYKISQASIICERTT